MLAALVACHAAVAAASPSVQTKAGSIVLAVDVCSVTQPFRGVPCSSISPVLPFSLKLYIAYPEI